METSDGPGGRGVSWGGGDSDMVGSRCVIMCQGGSKLRVKLVAKHLPVVVLKHHNDCHKSLEVMSEMSVANKKSPC